MENFHAQLLSMYKFARMQLWTLIQQARNKIYLKIFLQRQVVGFNLVPQQKQ